MGKFSNAGGREMPELNTSSLPDLVFAFLFFIDNVIASGDSLLTELPDTFTNKKKNNHHNKTTLL